MLGHCPSGESIPPNPLARAIHIKPQTPDDPDFPYVGKFIANLTLAQLKTLDCGSLRQDGYGQS